MSSKDARDSIGRKLAAAEEGADIPTGVVKATWKPTAPAEPKQADKDADVVAAIVRRQAAKAAEQTDGQ